MEEKKGLQQEVKDENVAFEEMEQVEELGNAQDYVNGVVAGITIVATVVVLT